MAKVVPLASAKAFLDALEKSGLLSTSDVTSLRASQGDDTDPKLIARDLVRENKLTKWQAGQLLHGFHQLVVGKYKLMDQLGTGEMGRVYLAEHAQLARKVSLKILGRKYTANPDVLKQVLDDGRKAAALDHHNLTHVFDVNSQDERYYLVTEYVEGKDLRQLVEASGETSPGQAIEIVRQASEGLEHAHRKGLVHGDLKPANLIVDASGVVKILDLGLARLTQTAPAAGGEESTEVVTLAAQSFRAPEQAGQQEVSPLVDIFSLGGILFYLLTGKPPLGNVKSAQDVKNACPAASDELAELCSRMLSESPAARPQSAGQVIAELESAALAKPIPAAKESKKEDTDKPAKQKKPLVAKPLDIPFPAQDAAAQADEMGIGIRLDDAAPEMKGESEAPPVAEPGATSEEPFAGFSLQTKRKKQKPEAAAAVPTPVPAAVAPASSPPDAPPTPAKSAQKPSLAIVLGVGIGGGVLILAIGITVLVWVLSRGGGKTVDKNAIAKADIKPADATATKSSEASSETNPEANPEVNPTVPSVTAATTTPEKTTPAVATAGPKTTAVPMPNPGVTDPVNTGVKPPMPMPPATTTPTPEPVKPAPTPEPVKPTPEPEKPASTPTPEPVKPAEPAAGNPLETFAKVVTLPPLEAKGKPVPEATKPFLLGAIKLPPKALCLINLKGGENAISTNAKQKFVLEAGNNGTSERDWEIKIVTAGSPAAVIVAKLGIADDQLNFQWTDEATKLLTSAPYLCNCVLTMSAGTGSHQLALRQPVTAEPMKVDLDKPMSAKYTIDYPPNPKQIVIQLAPPEGKFTKFKFEKPELTAKKDSTVFMTGPADETMLLHFWLNCSMSNKLLTIAAKPAYKIHGMNQPKPWMKNVATQIIPATEQANTQALQRQAAIAGAGLNAEQKAAQETQANKLVEDTGIQKTQAVMLTDLVKDLQGEGKLHFQILYEADTETKIVLVSTGGPPPMPPEP